MFPLRRPNPLATLICEKVFGAVAHKGNAGLRPRFQRPGFLLCFLVFFCVSASAQDYAAASIPEELKKDADAVVRTSEYSIDIKSPSHATVRERLVVTILNSRGADLAEYRTYYSNMIDIKSVEGVMYNAAGKELKHFKKKDMADRPTWDGMSLATDSRYKESSFASPDYPYTVSFDEEDELNGITDLSDWMPQAARNASVEYSRYTISAPKGYQIRYKMMNADLKPAVTEVKGKDNYSWEIHNIKPVPEEPFASPWYASQPWLLVGPSDFEAAGYKGNMSSWNDLGKFYGELARGRDVLPEDVRAKVHSLVAGETDPRKKINTLYDYLQKNTHYISVQLGIGGYQPFDAAYVSRNKYGDCKALSNYMVALLKEAGIPANVVIIRAGKTAADCQVDFPGQQFNHVICCVPMGKDSVWLECTDQFMPAGYLSSFTANRYGLMITPEGGKLVHTPDYGLAENREQRTIRAQLDESGNVILHSNGFYLAERQDELESNLHHLSRTEQEKWLKEEFDLPTYDVSAFLYQPETQQGLPAMRESLDITINGYAQASGKRLFINPDLLTRSAIRFSSGETRHRDFQFTHAYSLEDSVVINIPDGYTEEAVLKAQSLKSIYGEYRRDVSISPGKITYYRQFKQFRGQFPASSAADANSFYNAVYRADREKIVLVRKQ